MASRRNIGDEDGVLVSLNDDVMVLLASTREDFKQQRDDSRGDAMDRVSFTLVVFLF